MSGLGISTDFKMNKYIGKHQDNKRNGFGTFELKDGRKYEGFWRDNRLHGKCQETLEGGQSYLVYFNNGKKQDLLALDPQANGGANQGSDQKFGKRQKTVKKTDLNKSQMEMFTKGASIDLSSDKLKESKDSSLKRTNIESDALMQDLMDDNMKAQRKKDCIIF